MNPLTPFVDPILRAPTIGCMLMCTAAALVGVFCLLRRQALIGETLSHACYPGVILAAVIASSLGFEGGSETLMAVAIAIGGAISSLVGLYIIRRLEGTLNIPSDAALCFILAIFFGIGVTIASHVQLSHPMLYRSIQNYLYGQAATMTDSHIVLYGMLTLLVTAVITFFFKELQLLTFDRAYATTLGLPCKAIDALFFVLLVASIIIGIRAVGVVLMSAMLIAPAVTARQFCHSLRPMLFFAAASGAFSGYLGNYLSSYINEAIFLSSNAKISLATGPTIALTAATIAVMALLFAPNLGAVPRVIRAAAFRHRCLAENILKTIWKRRSKDAADAAPSFKRLKDEHLCPYLLLKLALWRLVRSGWLYRYAGGYCLTNDGKVRAAHIVRLHRLWEVYLADYLGVGAERVHLSAEEMEHVLTPELEAALTLLLQDPQQDPHHQPIPPKRGV